MNDINDDEVSMFSTMDPPPVVSTTKEVEIPGTQYPHMEVVPETSNPTSSEKNANNTNNTHCETLEDLDVE